MQMKKKLKKYCYVICLVVFSMLLWGCNSEEKIGETLQEDIMVFAREDGSGTKSEFERMIDTEEKGADAIAESTEEMLKMVEENTNGIGYLAYAGITEQQQIKVVAVDGIEPSMEMMKKGKYPLCRNYYLAYSGQLSDAASDFLRYVTLAGQKIIGEQCIAIKDSETFLSDNSKGTILITGSSSFAPIMEELIADYKNYNPNVTIELTVTDSTQGLTSAIRGECDLAVSSRELKDYEEELLTKKLIARDGIAVIVNQDNPITNLSQKNIKKIFDKTYQQWNELGTSESK